MSGSSSGSDEQEGTTMSNKIFRLRTGFEYSSNASKGDWRYFEDVDTLRVALMRAHVDTLTASNDDAAWRMARMWRAFWRGDDEKFPRVSRVYAVEEHVGSGWVPVTVRIIEPDVEIVGGSDV